MGIIFTTETGQKVNIGPTRLLINNEWVDSVSGETFETIYPASGEVICRVAKAEAPDLEKAVRAARAAFTGGEWPGMTATRRGELLYKLADLIEQHAEELARLETLDAGKTLNDARAVDLPATIACYRYFAGWADKVQGRTIPINGPFFCYTRHEPVGVVGLITPWNFPLVISAWKLAPALALGNTAILKPSTQTPLSALRIGELFIQAGFPPGVVNVLTGFGSTLGHAIAGHMDIDKVALTGSTPVGRLIMETAARSNLKRVTLELGGKSPNIIFADADLPAAIDGAHAGLFFHQGQVCCAGTRVFVEAKCYDEFVERSVERAQKRVIGDPFDEQTDFGPLVDQQQFKVVMDYIQTGKREGARLASGGERAGNRGFFVQPTVFADVQDAMRIAREEIFGPVMSIIKFKDLDEVIRRANDSIYGLAAGVWTRDITKALAVAGGVRAGTVWVNCYGAVDVGAPFGGFKQSGFGRELGEYGLQQYTEVKTVMIKL